MKRIIFICRHNACRSQMAEGWLRKLHGNAFEAYSAGLEAGDLDQRAVQVMREAGVDISKQRAKTYEDVRHIMFDCVVTVCGVDEGQCPVIMGGAVLFHAPFDDPPALARTAKTEEEALDVYRRVRDEIKRYVERLPSMLDRR